MICPEMEGIIEEVVADIYQAYPNLLEKYGEYGKEKCREDNGYHFKTLETAFSIKDDKIFIDYAHWLNRLLTSRGMETEHIIDNFKRIRERIQNRLKEKGLFYDKVLSEAIYFIIKSIIQSGYWLPIKIGYPKLYKENRLF